MPLSRLLAAVVGALALAVACSAPGVDLDEPPPSPAARDGSSSPTAQSPSPATTPGPPDLDGVPRPAWLGKRRLPLRGDGYGEIRPTPRVLRNRRLHTDDLLPPPEGDDYEARVRRVPRSVLARSTWEAGCPVRTDELRYVTVSFWGFDGAPHTGELLVHRSSARDLVGVFRRLHRARFPIEEMRVVAAEELDAHPTGDGNNTTAFVCRAARGARSFSAHAYGSAIDINPFHNPYVKDDVVLPELASAYRNREWRRPGMIFEGDPVVQAFDRIGWSWGGRWSSLVDYMHFSSTGR